MKIEDLIKKIENEQVKTAEDLYSSAGMLKLKAVAKAYNGEYRLIWSDKLLEEIKKRPKKTIYKTGISSLDEIIGGFKEQQLITLSAATKHGKCLAKGTDVLMFDGSIKKVEQIKVGEFLMGPDSKPRKVLSLGNGKEEMFEISQNGDSYTVNKSHILSLKKTGTNELINISVEDYLKTKSNFKHLYKGWKTGVDFPKKEVPIDPYFLGVWLGDGTSQNVNITNIDSEIENYLIGYASALKLKYKKKINKERTATLSIVNKKKGGKIGRYSLQSELRKLNVLNNKHIPEIYKINNREVRLKLLAGIIDTDGTLSNNRGKWHSYDIIQKSNKLTDDIVFLAKSLGFNVCVHKENKSIKSINFTGVYNRIRISGDLNCIPVLIERKKSKYKCKKDVLKSSIKLRSVGIGEYFGFELDGDGLFVLGNFIVTHNTQFGLFLMEKLVELNPVMIPLEQSNEEIIEQRLDNGYSIPKFLSPEKLAARVDVDWIEERIVEGIAKYDTKFVLIDHLGYINDFGVNGQFKKENLAYRIGQVMKSLKNIAKKWNVIIVLLVHISQKDESHPPTLEDIKNSSDIAQESDMVIMLWRKNEQKNKVRIYQNETLVSVMANRRTGRNGNVGLKFNTKTGIYEEDNDWVKSMEKTAIEEINADDNFQKF